MTKENPKNQESEQGKYFHLGDILTITTEQFVTPNGMLGIIDLLRYISGNDILFTNQLPRVAEECKPYLLNQYPELRMVDASEVNNDNWSKWLEEQVKEFGKMLPVRPIPLKNRHIKNPIQELREQLGRADNQ